MKKQKLLRIEDYLKTFNYRQRELLEDYFKVKKFIGKNLGRSEIQRKTKVPINRISNWTRKRRSIPFSVRCLTKAKERGYFSINIGSKRSQALAYLMGHCVGDGNISREHCKTWFYGHSDDLPTLNNMLKLFGIKGKIYIYKIHNGKMAIKDNAFTRFMAALECPIGDKTNSEFGIPKWILGTEKGSKIKRNFLQGLCDSELSSIKLLKKNRFAFQSLKFYSIKTEDMIKNGIKYLKQIISLFSEFGVKSSDVRVDRSYVRSRDDSKMTQLYFVIYSNYINLYNFISRIGFLYNRKRRDDSIKYFDLIKKHAQNETDKIEKYKMALKLRGRGLSAYRISKELNLPIHNAKGWLYHNHKPMLYNYVKSR